MALPARHPRLLVAATLVLIAARAGAQSVPATKAATTSAITAADLRTRLYLIADDSMRGRLAGSASDTLVTRYIASEMARVGLAPAGEDGGWFQIVHLRDRGGHEPTIPSRNVIGVLRGSDPVLRNEYVVISAHNDHVGIARQAVDHD